MPISRTQGSTKKMQEACSRKLGFQEKKIKGSEGPYSCFHAYLPFPILLQIYCIISDIYAYCCSRIESGSHT